MGGQEIAKDLILIGSDWWMVRAEYDGREWWDFCKKPEVLEWDQTALGREREITSFIGYWSTLDEINKKREAI